MAYGYVIDKNSVLLLALKYVDENDEACKMLQQVVTINSSLKFKFSGVIYQYIFVKLVYRKNALSIHKVGFVRSIVFSDNDVLVAH